MATGYIDNGIGTGMTAGKPRKAYEFGGLGLRDDEACLAATMRAEELGMYRPHDAEVLREDELTSYVLLKAGGKTATVVYSTPENNKFFSIPVSIIRRRTASAAVTRAARSVQSRWGRRP